RVTFDCVVIKKLRVCPYRSDRRHLVDNHGRRNLVTKHSQKSDAGVFSTSSIRRRSAAFRDQIKIGPLTICGKRKASIGVSPSLRQLSRRISTFGPQRNCGSDDGGPSSDDLTVDAVGRIRRDIRQQTKRESADAKLSKSFHAVAP